MQHTDRKLRASQRSSSKNHTQWTALASGMMVVWLCGTACRRTAHVVHTCAVRHPRTLTCVHVLTCVAAITCDNCCDSYSLQDTYVFVGASVYARVCECVCGCAGGTVLKLGTARHHQGLLRGIDNVDDIGCFALTELGFG